MNNMEEAVENFIELYDNESPIYEQPEAMDILEESCERFVNMVIDSVDKGYRIGDSLENFYYDKDGYVYKSKTDKMKNMDEDVIKFIKLYNNKSPIYEKPEAMNILEESCERFVNKVVQGTCKGFETGDRLRNFYYDEDDYLFKKL